MEKVVARPGVPNQAGPTLGLRARPGDAPGYGWMRVYLFLQRRTPVFE